MRALQANLLFSVAVHPASAISIETETLQMLGATTAQSEWVEDSLGIIKDTIWRAYEIVGRRMQVDPYITAEDARRMRIERAIKKPA